MNNNKNKEFDIIVYGATGFTGRLVAEYLHHQYGNGTELTWAMAGRSQAKLEQVRDEMNLPPNTPLVVADSSDPASMQKLVDRTSGVITTVGPYQLYGETLLAACASSGTDYVDLCGESVWMRRMIDKYEAATKKSGARIVFSCGFDSIPSDLGIYYLQSIAIEKTGKPCASIQGRVRGLSGTFSGGTAASIQVSYKEAATNPEAYQLAIDHFCLVPDYDGVPQPDGDSIHYSDEFKSWVAPFIMAAINTRNVHRSNALLGFQYGKDFTYDEMLLTGDGKAGEMTANHVANDKTMVGPDAPKPGEGPTKEERDAGFYDMIYSGQMANGEKIIVSVKGDRDPGYGSTCKMLSESMVCLLKDATDTKGGIWTTAPAMGDKLIARLQKNAGVTFTQEL